MDSSLFLPLMMVAMVGFMFYSQRKQQKQRQETLNQIKKSDEIVTIGGLFGIVDEIDDQKVVLDIDGIYLTFERAAIRRKVTSAQTTTTQAEAIEQTEEAVSESIIEE